jgi:phosphatidate cytidylyltransferase
VGRRPGGALWAGETVVVWLFAFVSFQALREFISVTYTRRGDYRALVWCFSSSCLGYATAA